MTNLRQQIEDLSLRMGSADAERDAQVALLEKIICQLEKRIEKLEGKERSI